MVPFKQEIMLLTSLLANFSSFSQLDVTSWALVSNPTPSSSSVQPQFTVPASSDGGVKLIANIRDPEAVLAQDVCPGYIATNVELVGETGLTAHLTLAGAPCNVYGNDVHNLDLLVEYQTPSRLHINIRPSHLTPNNESWFLLPTQWVSAAEEAEGTASNSELVFSWTNTPTFAFNVSRKATSELLFDTTGSKLVFEDQFIEFVVSQEDDYNLYGLGEVIHGLRLGNNLSRTIYACDAGDPIDANIYGSHPFYLQTNYYEIDADGTRALVSQDGSSTVNRNFTSSTHGVYLRNAHGMEVLLNPRNVTWRTIGGDIDLYLFSGPTQPEVTSQYLHVIGLPALQQYWTFGYHQSRWGYQNWSITEDVVDQYAKYDIPLETIWNDIDYMKGYRDFENDPVRFPYDEGREFLQRLHDRGQHYVPIIDSAIYAPNPDNTSDSYQPFNDGYNNATNAFILNPDGSLYIGAVWPGYTVFPDWLSSGGLSSSPASGWWQEQIAEYVKKLPIDGIWIDMSEVSSFCVGSCGSANLSYNPVHPYFSLPGEADNNMYDYPEGFNVTNATEAAIASALSASQSAKNAAATPVASSTVNHDYVRTKPTPGTRNVNYPPYVLNHYHGDLAVHTVSPNATHHNGVVEYDVHNLFGHHILQNTYAALAAAKPGERPFIIGRSTFVGSGNYSGHWGGDNRSKFYYMYFSIPQALSFSLFGIPMFGVDTCGFGGNTDEELCNRWMQLSALFPFYRNHNVLSAESQEAYVWRSVIEGTRKAMNIRFQLLPYLYTLFHHAHTRGDTVMRALAWEFPHDPTLADADRQFFLGPSILVTPVLTPGATSVDGVFPGLVEGTTTYYDWYNQTVVSVPEKKNSTIEAPLGHIPVYIRGGTVLATQEMRMTTRDARKSDWSLIIAPAPDGTASGSIYLDDGVGIEPNKTKMVTFSARISKNTNSTGYDSASVRVELDVQVEGDFTDLDLPLAKITVLGVDAAPDSARVKIDGKTVADAVWCAATKRVLVNNMQDVLAGKAWAKSWTMTI